MNKTIIIIWAYLSEIILSTISVFALLKLYDISFIITSLKSIALNFAIYFSGIMLAGSIAFFWAFYSKSDTPFSQWLYEKGAYNIYLTAYVTAIGIYASLTALLVITSKINNEYLTILTLWFLILGLINVYTFIKNITKQLKLNMEFNKKSRANNK